MKTGWYGRRSKSLKRHLLRHTRQFITYTSHSLKYLPSFITTNKQQSIPHLIILLNESMKHIIWVGWWWYLWCRLLISKIKYSNDNAHTHIHNKYNIFQHATFMPPFSFYIFNYFNIKTKKKKSMALQWVFWKKNVRLSRVVLCLCLSI